MKRMATKVVRKLDNRLRRLCEADRYTRHPVSQYIVGRSASHGVASSDHDRIDAVRGRLPLALERFRRAPRPPVATWPSAPSSSPAPRTSPPVSAAAPATYTAHPHCLGSRDDQTEITRLPEADAPSRIASWPGCAGGDYGVPDGSRPAAGTTPLWCHEAGPGRDGLCDSRVFPCRRGLRRGQGTYGGIRCRRSLRGRGTSHSSR